VPRQCLFNCQNKVGGLYRLGQKSSAPALMALTVDGMSAWPVTNMIGNVEPRSFSFA
jgi:hypothetical protein